jgi:succinyl-CoA synthetase beta subunit
LIDVILTLSNISHDFPEITELEINPLCVLEKGKGAYALDVRGESTSSENRE